MSNSNDVNNSVPVKATETEKEDRKTASGIAFSTMPSKDQAAFAFSMAGNEPYRLGPDSAPQEGVPQGELIKYHWKNQKYFEGTERDYWLYIPKQYDGSKEACLMVFQDGALYLSPDIIVPVVLDNLIHKGEIPLTIGLFVNAGDKGPGLPIYGGTDNRSVEYDSLGDHYTRFLLEELLPPIEEKYNIAKNPAKRAICGISSGAICAFTVAWERPEAFGKVISHCGSFTDIRGGHNYPFMIRKSEPKPIRIFLQSGTKDLNVIFGNWALANQTMATALTYREYDFQFVFGEGGHTLKHGGSIFPDTLRWLWRDYNTQS